MEWQKLYSRLLTDPKWFMLSDGAKALWLDCFLWTGQHESHGVIPWRVIQHHRAVAGDAIDRRDELVAVGLWDDADDDANGALMHNYAAWQPDVEQRRLHGKKRQSEYRKRHPSVSNALLTAIEKRREEKKEVTNVTSPSKNSTEGEKRSQAKLGLDVAGALGIWNEHKHPNQPAARSATGTRRQFLERFIAACNGDPDTFRQSVAAFGASAEHNGTKPGGRAWPIDTMLRNEHRDKWIDAASEPVASSQRHYDPPPGVFDPLTGAYTAGDGRGR